MNVSVGTHLNPILADSTSKCSNCFSCFSRKKRTLSDLSWLNCWSSVSILKRFEVSHTSTWHLPLTLTLLSKRALRTLTRSSSSFLSLSRCVCACWRFFSWYAVRIFNSYWRRSLNWEHSPSWLSSRRNDCFWSISAILCSYWSPNSVNFRCCSSFSFFITAFCSSFGVVCRICAFNALYWRVWVLQVSRNALRIWSSFC